jgi:hypothetical protein
MDSADKSSNKAIAAAMKYAIFQMFCIPTEDMRNNDPDKETPDANFPALNICDECGKQVTDYITTTGITKASDIVNKSREKYGRCLCGKCSVFVSKAS